ncbi:MAG: 3-keto-5-aminohexanoate cleavage protein [Alphaproteobacteria bacterium]|nr:3-keto-5-aminohexanoate cleavage protein [Alphaproteobacteria bacterium]
MTDANGTNTPLILAVAPNGARKTKADHPALPMTADEIGQTAAACREVGAVMIHLHVRTAEGVHTLDAGLYRDAIAAVRREAGADFIVQVTSEAVGLYKPDEQRAMVKSVRPEAVSLAIRELCATPQDEPEFAAFTAWMAQESIHPQYILYDAADVARFADLQRRGVLSADGDFVLYVLGRYSKSLTSEPSDLLPFLTMAQAEALVNPWAICAFGPKEAACGLTAAALGGHCRLGFENNLRLANGEIASDNAHLIAQVADQAALVGRVLADESSARLALGMK